MSGMPLVNNMLAGKIDIGYVGDMPAIVLAKLQNDASYQTLVAAAQFAVGPRTEAAGTIARIDSLATTDMAARIAVRSRLAPMFDGAR